MLELGKTRPQKRAALLALALVHVASLAALIAAFAAYGPQLPPLLAVLVIVSITAWLFTFVLLCVNLAYYFMRRS